MQSIYMEAYEMIEKIIEAHEEGVEEIDVCDSLVLEPQLDYTGKMARDAFRGKRKKKHKDRRYAGIIDFKVFIEGEGMEHEKLISSSVRELPLSAIREVHHGKDPEGLEGLSKRQEEVAQWLQAGFVEQELNWGEEPFQSKTYFGRSSAKDELLRRSAPRDFQTVFIEKCYDEYGSSDETRIYDILERYLRRSKETKNLVIWPPMDWNTRKIKSDFRDFMPPNLYGEETDKWVEPYVDRIKELCEEKGPNPHHPDLG